MCPDLNTYASRIWHLGLFPVPGHQATSRLMVIEEAMSYRPHSDLFP